MWQHYPRIELPISIEQFHTLPRNPGYKYEYWDGRAVLTPRPKSADCVRDLSPVELVERHEIKPLPTADILGLADIFAGAFAHVQPFQSLGREAADAAARDCLEKTVTGRDGPLVADACFQAWGRWGPEERGPVGAILITLNRPEAATESHAPPWTDPPADAVERRLGVPHLTWVFVHWTEARRGVGTALLAAAVSKLAEMGYTQLASTFALDNPASALWHWQHGFRLLPFMSAWRRERLKKLSEGDAS